MSTTRKIEGWVDIHTRDGQVEGWFGQERTLHFPSATLIIGGKGYTEEEVEADRTKLLDKITRLEGTTNFDVVPKEVHDRTREVAQSLVDVMRLIHPSCMVLHHEPSEKHADHEACPVKARFYNVLALAKSQLQIEPTK